MKFSKQWLNRYLETKATPEEIAAKLVELGHEVESLDDPSARLKGFVYARVVECAKHPNADRLSLCKIDAGTGELIQVVCGAPNVKANMGVAFASVGTVIPSTGEALKKGKIRDIESHGMLCSARELLLGEDSDGIMDLGVAHKPGVPLTDFITCDAVFDVSITPNRGDCFSVYGIARDLSASGLGILKSLDLPTISRQGETPTVSLTTPLCFQFGLCRISGVKNAVSPAWLQDLLISAGQKPISTLVDITNYFCLGLGRPMHVFDADKVHGHLVVREAKDGEMLKALNGQEYHLKDGMVVVADDRGVEAIGGIMGGNETAVDENTTNILLEAAIFDPISIATTGQRLNLISDSRTRLERGVDTAVVKSLLDMAAKVIVEYCGGTPATALLIGNQLKDHAAINLDHKQVEQLLGLAVEPNEVISILEHLGCTVGNQDNNHCLKITPPTWRHDLKIPEDLIEEIARLKGYGEIAARSLPLKPVHNLVSREEIARKYLGNRGFLETLNWSFTDKVTAQAFSESPDDLVHLANPLNEDFSVMCPSILAPLFKVAKFNTLNARPNGAIFEISHIYGNKFPAKQTMCIAGVRFGSIHERHWLSDLRSADVFDAKADAMSTLKTLGIAEESVQLSSDGPNHYHPGRKGSIRQGRNIIAHFGELNPKIAGDLRVVGFEIFLEILPMAKAKKVQDTLTDLMPVRRDFAFVIDASVPAEKLIRAIEKADPLVTRVDVFDCYQGSHVEQGKKSLAFAVTLQPTQKTLDESALAQIHQAVVNAAANVGAQLR